MGKKMPVMAFPWLLLLLLLHCAVPSTSDVLSYQTYELPNNTLGPAYVSIRYSEASALTGIANGDVLKFSLLTGTFTPFSSIPNRNGALCDNNTDPNLFGVCGRPLGIAYNNAGYAFFCDTNNGLFGVGPSGGQANLLVAFAGGLPVYFCNAVDVDRSGTVYFTDASQNFRNSTLSRLARDATGRLISYMPSTGQVRVLANGLYTPTGLAVSSDNSFILVTQLGNNSISKYFLSGPNAGTIQTFVSGFYVPVNVRRSLSGSFYYVPQNPIPFIHYLVKINSSGAVVGNVSIAGPYSSTKFYRDARPIAPWTFLLGSQFTNFLGKVVIPGF